MSLQLRRGTNAQRLSMTPAAGELIHVTDFQLVWVTVTGIAANLMTTNAVHGLTVGQKVKFISSTQRGATQNAIYYVIADGFTSTKFKISTTLAGTAVTLTDGTSLNMQFAKTPTLANLDPVGFSATAVYVGNGVTVGGIPATTQTLGDLVDVTILGGAYDKQHLEYDGTTAQWINRSDINMASDGTLFLNPTNGVEFANGDSAQPNMTWDATNQAIKTNTTFYANNDIIANRYFGTNDRLITFNNDDAEPASTDNMILRVKRGSLADSELMWNETTDRWEFNYPITTLSGNGVRSSQDLFGTGYHGFVAAGTTGDAIVGNNLILQRQGTNADMDAMITVDRATATGVDTSIRWNETTDKWQYTNDGTNYVDFIGSINDNITSSRFTIGAIRDTTTNTNGDSWSQLSGAGSAYRGISIDNSANTAKRPALVLRSYSGGASNPRSTIAYETSRGTPASPTALQFGDFLGEFAGYARTTTGWIGDLVAAAPAGYSFYAAENFSGLTNVGAGFALSLQPTGTTLTSAATRITVMDANPQSMTLRSDTITLKDGKSGGAGGTQIAQFSTQKAQFNVPVSLQSYTTSYLNGITGSMGMLVCVSDAGGRPAFWNTGVTPAKWCFVSDNTPI